MNNFAAASNSNNPTHQPRLETPSLARVDASVMPPQPSTSAGVVAVSANWDTDFRKKIGIERWGWGLNE